MVDTSQDEDEYTMWSRPFEFGNVKLRVEEEWGVGIGGTIWEGGVLLANYLSCKEAFQIDHLQGTRCIEIGTGVSALPGLVAASLGCFSEVVLTDIAECMEGLRANVEANLPASCSLFTDGAAEPALGQTRVRVDELDWRQDPAHLRPPFEVVLVADVVYIADLMQPLLECLQALSTPDSLILFAFYNRSDTVSGVFWQLLPQYFEHTKIPEASYGARPQPDGIGLFKLTRKC